MNHTGVGAGYLSAAAVARLARGLGDPEVALPDLTDPASVGAWRSWVHGTWGEGTEGDEPLHRSAEVAGVPVLAAGPSGPPMTVVYFHGGAYALGSPAVAAPITARLARHLGVISVDYRLAPEHRYPAALDDAEAVFRAVRDTSDHPVGLAGDSAGGALALGVAFRLALAGDAMPCAIAALCPHLQHSAREPVHTGPGDTRPHPRGSAEESDNPQPPNRVPHQPGSAEERAVRLADLYLGDADPEDPLASPLLAPPGWLAALPPTLVQAGTLDPLWRTQAQFVRRARACGAPVTLDLWDGMWHAWHYHRKVPEADAALEEVVRFLHGPRS